MDHIGLEQLAAVDGSGESCDHLDGGDGESLAEGTYRRSTPVIVFRGQTVLTPSPVQIDIGGLCQTEGLEIFIKLLDAQPLADLHKGRVAGVLHRLRQGLGAVARAFLEQLIGFGQPSTM